MSLQLVEAYADALDDDTDDDVCWFEYCRIASTLHRDDVLAIVLEELAAEDSCLYDLIDSAITAPHEPGRPKESISVLAAVGQAIMHIAAKAVDDQVGLRMAVQGVPR